MPSHRLGGCVCRCAALTRAPASSTVSETCTHVLTQAGLSHIVNVLPWHALQRVCLHAALPGWGGAVGCDGGATLGALCGLAGREGPADQRHALEEPRRGGERVAGRPAPGQGGRARAPRRRQHGSPVYKCVPAQLVKENRVCCRLPSAFIQRSQQSRHS